MDRKRTYSPFPFALAGVITIVLAFGAIGGWAATAPLAGAVIARGLIAVETNTKTIQHLEGGLVSAIHVREADRVQAGQPLLELQTVEATANVQILRKRLAIARAVEARLLAEGRLAVSSNDGIEPLLVRDTAGAEAAPAITAQADLFTHRRNVLENQTEILERRIDQIAQQVQGLTRLKQALESENRLMVEEIARLREGSGSGVVATNRLAAMEREGARLSGEIGTTEAEIARAGQLEAETRLEIVKLHNEFLERAVTELKLVQEDIAELEEQIAVVDDVFARKIIRASTAGVVQNLAIHGPGAVVSPGEPIMQIVPLNDRLIVNARIRPVDIEHVGVGMRAEIRLPSSGRDHVQMWRGTIETISADIVRSGEGEEPYYLARIQAEQPDASLLPGMPVDIIVPTRERTVLQYLADPMLDALQTGMREQ